MKNRIMTGVLFAVLLVAVMFAHQTVVLNIVVAAVSLVAVYEGLRATGFEKNKPLTALCIVFCVVTAFLSDLAQFKGVNSVVFVFVVLFFLAAMYRHDEQPLESIGLAFVIALIVPLGLSCMVFMRGITGQNVPFYIMLTIIGSWVTDIGAYFTGTFFGKHKMAPKISPKKTVEGLFGGLVLCIACFALWGWLYQTLFLQDGGTVQFLPLMLLSIPASLVGVVGDLTFSLIKRACGVKDFSNLLPGHGGMLDRFDSTIFVAPFLYLAIQVVSIIT